MWLYLYVNETLEPIARDLIQLTRTGLGDEWDCQRSHKHGKEDDDVAAEHLERVIQLNGNCVLSWCLGMCV